MTYKWKNDSCIKSMDNKEINMNGVEAMLMLAISKCAEGNTLKCGQTLVLIAKELFGMSDEEMKAKILLAKVADMAITGGLIPPDIMEKFNDLHDDDIGEGVN